MKTKTETLVKALRIIERAIPSEDGIANSAIGEAANRLEEMHAENNSLREAVEWLKDVARQHTEMSAKGIYYTIEELANHDAAVIDRFSCDFVQALTAGDGVGFNNLTEEMFRGFCREYTKQLRKQVEETKK